MPPSQSPASFHEFGALLRFLRRRARMTQREVAIAVGYSESQISRYEQSHRPPDDAALRALFLPALAVDPASDWGQRLLVLAANARAAGDAPPPEPPATQPAELPAGLLATKLFRPRPRSNLVPRPRLIERCAAALAAPLTLIAAPAGSGKTTLLSSWLSQIDAQGGRSAWLALDASDNDPVTFLRYLVAAIQTFAPNAGSSTLALLRTPLPPPPVLLAPLINDLASLNIDCVLVLDDYHLAGAAEISAMISFLLEHFPPRLHLVISSREDPPLPLARMRARRELLEIRAGSLRFTSDEAAVLLGDVTGSTVSAAQVAAVEAQTEGWAAGLQLAGLALSNHADPARLLAGFSGNHRYLIDYLALEVLDGLPAHLRSFLLHTAILDRMCGPLCDAVLGVGGMDAASAADSHSQVLLNELERRNIFLVPLDDERRWFRYHHLFAEFLRTRLREGVAAGQRRMLHGRAGAWLEQHGLVEEAIPHMLASTDLPQAARLINRIGLSLASRGHMHTVLGWLRAFPEQELRERPELCLIYAVLLLNTQQPTAASTWLDASERALSHASAQPEQQGIRGGLLVARASVARFTGDLERCVADSTSALAVLGETSPMFRSIAVLNSAFAFLVGGDVRAESEQRVRLALTLTERAGNLAANMNALVTLSLLQTLQGRRRMAGETLATVMQRLEDQQAGLLSGAAAGYLAYAEWLREHNRLAEAEQYLAAGWELMSASLVDAHILGMAVMTQVRVCLARGDRALAEHALRDCAQRTREHPAAAQIAARLNAAHALLDIAAGRGAAAARWAATLDPYREREPWFLCEWEYLILARAWLAQADGQPALVEQALGLLEPMLADAEARDRVDSVLRILVVRAGALQLFARLEEALATLGRALVLAAPEGYVRLFLDEGQPMAALLRIAHSRGIAPDYCARLLDVFGTLSASSSAR